MPVPASLLKHTRRLAREDVYVQLSAWIIEGTLQPGETLRDQDIAERLDVSRTPVREALRRLEDEGFVETALNRWTRVAPLDPVTAAELYPVIETLEVLALRLAFPHLDSQDYGELEGINLRLEEGLRAGDVRAAVLADSEFHAVWINRAGNAALRQTLLDLKRKLQRIELAYFDHQASARASVAEHADLIQTLRHGRLDAAEGALRQNWIGSLQRLDLSLKP